MTTVLLLLFSMAQPVPTTLDQVKTIANLEHRANLALDYALAAERKAEDAYSKSGEPGVTATLGEMLAGVELAKSSLDASGKKPYSSPKYFKYAEQKSRELLKRLESLEQKMDADERKVISAPKDRIDAIHDGWLQGIMGKKT